MPIAIDVMGGDSFPQNPVTGAIQAVNDKNIDVFLVGSEPVIKQELEKHKFDARKVEIINTTEVITMDDPVVSALRTKKDSSMRVCFDLHKKGLVDGVVSAGNSGAMLAIGRFVLKMIPGIDRPCISALLPSTNRKVLLLDAGANIDCAPETLLQFAILGSVYMEHIHSIKNPRIGLLNIGSEESKGDERSRLTYQLLKNCPLNFVGNVEGKEFFQGEIDVVVTDGFAGNILLKSVQGAADFVKEILKEEIKDSLLTRIVALYFKPAILRLKKRTDYAEFGGAPLLGLKGNSIVCHGGSNSRALAFGISFADWAAKAQLEKRMEEKILEYQRLFN